VQQTSNPTLSTGRRRLIISAAAVGMFTCAFVIVAITWAILYIHKDRSHLTRVTGTIVSVNGSERSSFGRSVKFGTYSLTVKYRMPDGEEETDRLDKKTFGFPSKGDSINLLIDPRYGHIESSPFPELWILLACVYAGLGWLIWFFLAFSGRALDGKL
jgi:hypothetical protein